MPLLTVFTPAYNRAHTLPRTYESLCRQDCKDFIWLIIDDGSTDNTSELVKEWMSKDNGFEIRYIYKENGGMHTAHNVAYEHIDTELNTCIDSDDKLAEGAAERPEDIEPDERLLIEEEPRVVVWEEDDRAAEDPPERRDWATASGAATITKVRRSAAKVLIILFMALSF